MYFAYPIYCSLNLYKIKQQQQHIIDNKHSEVQFEARSMSADVFKRHYNKREKELVLDGIYYEVISYKIREKNIICILQIDREESIFTAFIIKHTQHNNNKKIKAITYWWPLIQPQCLVMLQNTIYYTPTNHNIKTYYLKLSKGHLFSCIKPPELV